MGRRKGSLNHAGSRIPAGVHYLKEAVLGPLTARKAKRLLEDAGHLASFYERAGVDPDNPPAWSTIERWITRWRDVPYNPSATVSDLEKAQAMQLLRDDPFRYSVRTWLEMYPQLRPGTIYHYRAQAAGPRLPEWRLIGNHPYCMTPLQRRKLFGPQTEVPQRPLDGQSEFSV